MPPRQRDLRHKGAASRGRDKHPVRSGDGAAQDDGHRRAPSRILAARRIGNRENLRIMPAATPGFVHLHVHSSLFAARGRADDCALGGACQERPPAGAGADRHRQHVRRAGILREDGGRRHSADHRLRTRGRFRRSGYSWACGRAGVCPHRAPCRARARLPQPDAALLARLSRHRANRAAAHQARVACRRGERADRAQRRVERAARSRHRRRPKRARAIALRRNCNACSAIAFTSSCSVMAWRRNGWPSRR